MGLIEKTLLSVPLFRHAGNREIAELSKLCRTMTVTAGKELDIKNSVTMNIVLQGMFELEALGSSDMVYLSHGSFFGSVPFSSSRLRGKAKALTESELILIDSASLFRFLFTSFPLLRGYLVLLNGLGIPLEGMGEMLLNARSKVITVTGSRESGKTLVSSLLAAGMSRREKTLLVDLSYTGTSSFTLFGTAMLAPLAARSHDGEEPGDIHERIVQVRENLFLLNVANGSSVKVNKRILSPLVAALASRYSTMIFDARDDDLELLEECFDLSDDIHIMMPGVREKERLEEMTVRHVSRGQRVYFYLNRYFSHNRDEELIYFDRVHLTGKKSPAEELMEAAALSQVEAMVEKTMRKRDALVVESRLHNALLVSGFMGELFSQQGVVFDRYYTSAYSYTVTAMAQNAGDRGEFVRNIHELFDEHRINKFLQVSFPQENIFENQQLQKFFRSLMGKRKAHQYTTLPVAGFTEPDGTMRQFSTGLLYPYLTAAMTLAPYYEPVELAGTSYVSGYPGYQVEPENLVRNRIDEITLLSVNNRENPGYFRKRVLPFYEKIVNHALLHHRPLERSELAVKHITIEADEKDMKIDRLMEVGAVEGEKFLESMGKKMEAQ